MGRRREREGSICSKRAILSIEKQAQSNATQNLSQMKRKRQSSVGGAVAAPGIHELHCSGLDRWHQVNMEAGFFLLSSSRFFFPSHSFQLIVILFTSSPLSTSSFCLLSIFLLSSFRLLSVSHLSILLITFSNRQF